MKQVEKKSIHIPYDQKVTPYHKVVAGLVCTYCHDNTSLLDIGCRVGHTLNEIKKRPPQ